MQRWYNTKVCRKQGTYYDVSLENMAATRISRRYMLMKIKYENQLVDYTIVKYIYCTVIFHFNKEALRSHFQFGCVNIYTYQTGVSYLHGVNVSCPENLYITFHGKPTNFSGYEVWKKEKYLGTREMMRKIMFT